MSVVNSSGSSQKWLTRQVRQYQHEDYRSFSTKRFGWTNFTHVLLRFFSLSFGLIIILTVGENKSQRRLYSTPTAEHLQPTQHWQCWRYLLTLASPVAPRKPHCLAKSQSAHFLALCPELGNKINIPSRPPRRSVCPWTTRPLLPSSNEQPNPPRNPRDTAFSPSISLTHLVSATIAHNGGWCPRFMPGLASWSLDCWHLLSKY